MTNYNRVINQYKEQSVETMTSIEMLAVLYDEAIKRIRRSKIAFDAKDNTMFENELTRAVEIIMYLDNTLDKAYEISASLHMIYDYMSYELNKIRVSNDFSRTDDLCVMLTELKENFIQADASLRKK